MVFEDPDIIETEIEEGITLFLHVDTKYITLTRAEVKDMAKAMDIKVLDD